MTDTAVPATPSSAQLNEALRPILQKVRRRLPRLAQRLTDEIQATVPEYASGERRRQLIFTAVNTAATHFLDLATGEAASPAAVDDLYRKMGYREARLGGDTSTVESAVRIGTRAYWDEIRVAAADAGLSSFTLEDLHDLLVSFVDHLVSQVRHGRSAGAQDRDQDIGLARRRLADALLSGGDPADVEAQAAVAGWPIPELVVVSSIELSGDAQVSAAELPDEALYRTTRTGLTAISRVGATDEVVEAVRAHAPQARVALCWPVAPRDAPAAHRWTQRALALVARGVIPARPVIDCDVHRTEIWLHAEPVLRRQLAQELLQPLFAETPNSREILSETLLVWLESRDSAPAIAARLGVHPQTVRYRWRRINELFGEDLHDPEVVTQLFLVLKASVPLWIAGDQSDFERFQSQQASDRADGVA